LNGERRYYMITAATMPSATPQPTQPPVGDPPAAPTTAPERRIYAPVQFDNRSRPVQVVIGGLIPIAVGALAGILIGSSATAYWVLGLLAGVGAFLSGFEHRGGWEAADRGFFGGVFYGVALLVVHALVGTEAKVSLGSFPPLLVVITAIAGMLLAATGGRIGRALRERAGLQAPPDPDER
jgi:hypothetical protein